MSRLPDGTFRGAYEYLASRHASHLGKWSLGPTLRLLEELGNPHFEIPTIHVGGSKGKGSVCWMLAEALRETGLSVGLYTSPHLVSVTERVLVDGQPIGEDAFAMWADRLTPVIERTSASFFEATTAIAFADLAARKADVAVVEVGLGGRLDATNVVRPMSSAVVQIELEHQDYLGDSLEAIAREKAGIAKPGTPFVIGEHRSPMHEVLRDAAESAGALVTEVGASAEFKGRLALHGRFQRRNAAIARGILDTLPGPFQVSQEDFEAAVANMTIPGRGDVRGGWIFDVAHTVEGITGLVALIGEMRAAQDTVVLASFLRDKNWRKMIQLLSSVSSDVVATVPPSAPPERLWDLDDVRAEFPSVRIEADFDRALELVRDHERRIVTGSFHTVGDAMARLPGFAPVG